MIDANTGKPMNDVVGVVLTVLGLSVAIMSGFLKFLTGRMSEIETKHEDVEGSLRQEMQKYASEHNLAQRELWQELRQATRDNNLQHSAMAASIAALVKRDELDRGLAAMEERLTAMLRKDVASR